MSSSDTPKDAHRVTLGPVSATSRTIELGALGEPTVSITMDSVATADGQHDGWANVTAVKYELTPLGRAARTKGALLNIVVLFAPTGVSGWRGIPLGYDWVRFTQRGTIPRAIYAKLPPRMALPKGVRQALTEFIESLSDENRRAIVFSDPPSAFRTFAEQKGIASFVTESEQDS